jgi:lipopolysaccharide export system protein LptA
MPVVVGWLRPVILIPAAALSGLPPQQLDALILHELAHIRRHDALINALLLAAETLLFYHPAIWWVSRRIRIEREHCCDDLAVARCGDAALYVEALATLEAGRLPPGLALAAGVRLKDRAARLLGAPSQTRRHSLGAITGLAAVALVAVSVAVAQPGAPAQAVAQMDFLQITDDKGMQPPIEINADKISHDTRGRPTIFFDGHVTIQQGGITIRADNGESPDGMRTRLLVSGHVVLTQNGKTVKSDHLEIDVSDRTLRLAGQHRVTVSPAMIPAPAQGNAAIGIEGSTNSRDGLVTKITGLQITDDKGAQPPITIHADNVRNDAQGRPTQFEGNAIVQQGGITVRANSIRAEVASAAPPSGGKLTRLIADGDVVVTQDGKTVRTTHLEADVRDNKLAISLSGGVQLELH